MKHLNVEDFEFSQGYLFFWDKIERCNNFLNNIVETARRNDSVDGRLVSFLLEASIIFSSICNGVGSSYNIFAFRFSMFTFIYENLTILLMI